MTAANPESLFLVGEALASTLNDARAVLENYAEGEGSRETLERCAGLLHMAKGALQMTETFGASLLAEEMEETCRYIANNRRQEGTADEGVEALSRAMVQLPTYVERILAGGRDIPLVLLPLLNDLRAARGRPLLSESTLLLLNLGEEQDKPKFEPREPSGEDIVALCKGLRPQFQLGLLNLIKGSDSKREIQKMSVVVERLEKAAKIDEVHQLWWVFGGVLEAVSKGGLEITVAIKRLMGQADREIKRLQSVGEVEFAQRPPIELINNLLYYVARSSTGGPRVAAIRAAFNLSDLSPGDEQVELVRESLAAPSARLMKTVANAIREDLAKVKDVLDIYARTGMDNLDELALQAELLKKISDTLGVLGLGSLRETVLERSREIHVIVKEQGEIEPEVLEKMAAALLTVEDRLDEQLISQVAPRDDESDDGSIMDADFRQVTEAVMRECIVNLSRVKEAIAGLLETTEDSAELDNVPSLLLGITAGLMMLDKTRAVETVDGIGKAISSLVQQGYQDQQVENMNRLADAMVSLEYYMETLQGGRKEPVYMLDNAQRCLAAMSSDESFVGEVAAEQDTMGFDATVRLPEADLEAIAAGEAADTAVAEGARGEPAPVVSADKEKLDPALLEIFIEEAREEIASIRNQLPVWQSDAESVEALVTVRRSFHTLKGSGRMVGAELIGEYCWSIENLLNRLINNTLQRTDSMVAFLTEVVAVLPDLLEQLEVGTPPAQNIDEIIEKANAYASGDFVEAAATVTEKEEPITEDLIPAESIEDTQLVRKIELESEAAPEEMPTGSIDPVLIEILMKEATAHLGTIGTYLQNCNSSSPPYPVTEDVYRACHTLHGSVNMANASDAITVLQPLNHLIEEAYKQGVGVSDHVLVVLENAAVAIGTIIRHLEEPSVQLPSTDGLVGHIQALLDNLIRDRQAAAELAEPAAEEQPVTEVPAAAAQVGDDVDRERDHEPESEPEQEFDAEIAAIFSEEAAEILEAADGALSQLSNGGAAATAMGELQRHLHTLKGGARMAGVSRIGDFSHELETLLDRLNAAGTALDAGVRDLLQSSIDELHRMREQVMSGIVAPPPSALFERLRSALQDASGEVAAPEAPARKVAEPEIDTIIAESSAIIEERPRTKDAAPVEEAKPPPGRERELERLGELARELTEGKAPDKPESADAGSADTTEAKETAGPPRSMEADLVSKARPEMARVDSELLEDALNNAGEISIFHSRLNQQVGSIQFNLDELGQTVARLREQLRKLEIETEAQILYRHQDESTRDDEFDPLELDRYSTIQQLTRALTETASDVNSLNDLLNSITTDTEGLLVQQGRTIAELQDHLMRTRMVPFHQHVSRLSRLVRQIASETGKQVELVAEGGSGELDRQVMEKMLPPFEHMLRNAVIHGIESPKERKAAGKSEAGRISIIFRREGSEVVIDVFDDGRGLDVGAIKTKAEQLGFLRPGQSVTDEEAVQLILRSGFSMADRLTQAAGRGIGMDVVASEIAKLGGTLGINSTPGQGCVFTIRLPYTLAVTQAFVVRVGIEVYALPLPSVEGIVRIPRREFDERMVVDDPSIEYGSQKFRFRYLGQYLGHGPPKLDSDEDQISIILVRAGENSAALITDEMLDNREIVVKPIGPQLATIHGISGATILGDGRIAVILDVAALVRSTNLLAPPEAPPVSAEPDDLPPLALVVDDSITMRRITQRLLERNGMRVMTAKDGVEAVKVLQDHVPDIILLDVEMPRMDGYEFAKHVRNAPEIANTPIIMVTSRVSEKHRARAIELGVNDYVGKPYQEQELLDAIRGLLTSVAEHSRRK